MSFSFPVPAIADEFILKLTPSPNPPTIEEIYHRIWQLSTSINSPDSYQELVGLTNELIRQYEKQDRLVRDPFEHSRKRFISLDFAVFKELKDSTCLVLGGLGCVGSRLVQELTEFNVKTIIIVDLISDSKKVIKTTNIISFACDIREAESLQNIFSTCNPDFVFHLAAQRDPGLAEAYIEEAVTTNVLGTYNVIKACEATFSVKQMVFSSTGKASRYYTEEVYSASKKIAEFLVTAYAEKSSIKYSMVRFTHILDNSLMNIRLEQESLGYDYVAVHSPGKYVCAQNAEEAVCLMLNALVYSEENKCNLLLVRHLDWPIESLEVALHYIRKSQRKIPVIFLGNPKGYAEKFFRGQFDWSQPEELNLLINVYEQKNKRLNAQEDIIISKVCNVSKCVLDRAIDQISQANGEVEMKRVLLRCLKDIVRSALTFVDKEDTANILRWGLDPAYITIEKVNVAEFNPLISLLVESLAGSEYDQATDDLVYQLL